MHERALPTELVQLRAQIDPAGRRVGRETLLPGHLADRAQDDRDPIRILGRTDLVLQLDVGNLLPHVLFGIGSAGGRSADLKVELAPL